MCLLILEILFLILGLWLLFTGKIPDRFFRALFGKGAYSLPPLQARLFGLFLASPIPLVFGLTFILASISGQNPTGTMTIVEVVYVIVVAIVSIIVARNSRRAPAVPDTTDSAAK
jgi:hypothetical protein